MAPVDHYLIKKNSKCPSSGSSGTIILVPVRAVENCNPIEGKKQKHKKLPFYWGLKSKRELKDQGIKK